MDRKRRVSVLLILCTLALTCSLLAFAGCQTLSGLVPGGAGLPEQYERESE